MKPHPTVGKEYGNYVVRGLLGEGGMGAVFAAEHKFLGDHVAIKILHGTYAQNRSVTERFFLEAKATRDISHPNVIKIFDFGMAEDGGLYLVMELLEGRTLTSFLQAGRPEEKVLARIGAEIADGLAAAHEKGIIHRDLKPDNIFLVCDGLKILDFGIAKVLTSSGGNGPAKTGTGALLGTPRYMAPEQAKGAKFVGPHSDTYSLGVILFEMVTGRAPFEAGDLAELLTKILLEPAPRPSEFAPVSPELEELIVSCLAKDPAARPSGMDEVRERLGKLAGGASIGALSAVRGSGQLPALSSAHAATATGTGEMATRVSVVGERTGGRNLALAGAIVLGIVMGGVGAFVGLRQQSRPAIVLDSPLEGAVKLPRKTPGSPPAKFGNQLTVNKPLGDPAGSTAAELAAPVPVPVPVLATVIIRSEPPGANVEVDDKPQGVTPAVVTVTLPHQVTLRLAGYQVAREVLMTQGETRITLTPLARHSASTRGAASEAAKSGGAEKPARPAAPSDVSLE